MLYWAAAVALSFAALPEAPAARPGDLDSTFGVVGKVQTAFGAKSSYGRDIALQTEGKMVVVGYSGIYPGFNSAIARYNSDGTLDTTFGTNGTVVSHFSTTDMFAAVAIQSDGKIVAVGSAAVPPSGSSYTAVLVALYNSNGTLDPTFGSNSAVINTLPGDSSAAQDINLLADGRILVGGYTITVDFARIALLRYNSNGSLDQTYGTAGSAIIEFPVGGYSGGAAGSALALQANGKAVLVGTFTDNSFGEFALARANSDGSPDTSFGTDGRVTTSLGVGDAVGSSVIVQFDGKIVAAGYFEAGNDNHDFALARYAGNGTLDPGFGRAGIALNGLTNGSDDLIKGIALQSDSKIVAVGQTGNYPTFDFGVARYTTTGRLDKTFGRKGKVSTGFGITNFGSNSFDSAYAIVIALDGKIIARPAQRRPIPTGNLISPLTRYLNP